MDISRVRCILLPRKGETAAVSIGRVMSVYILATVILLVGFTPLTILLVKAVRQRRSAPPPPVGMPVREEVRPVASRKAMPSVDDLVAKGRKDTERIEVWIADEEDDDGNEDTGLW